MRVADANASNCPVDSDCTSHAANCTAVWYRCASSTTAAAVASNASPDANGSDASPAPALTRCGVPTGDGVTSGVSTRGEGAGATSNSSTTSTLTLSPTLTGAGVGASSTRTLSRLCSETSAEEATGERGGAGGAGALPRVESSAWAAGRRFTPHVAPPMPLALSLPLALSSESSAVRKAK